MAGLLVLVLSGWLSRLEGLPQEVLLFSGTVNLLYAAYSFSLAVRPVRPMGRIRLLAVANVAWAPVCVGLIVVFGATATPVAYVHFVGEAIYVGGLGLLEWRYRDALRTAA